jgi:transposase-like protein
VSDTFTPLISPNLAPFAFAPIKRLVRPGLGFESMRTARPIIAGYEIFAMIRKGQFATIPATRLLGYSALVFSL